MSGATMAHWEEIITRPGMVNGVRSGMIHLGMLSTTGGHYLKLPTTLPAETEFHLIERPSITDSALAIPDLDVAIRFDAGADFQAFALAYSEAWEKEAGFAVDVSAVEAALAPALEGEQRLLHL
jgi:hypothetical protein